MFVARNTGWASGDVTVRLSSFEFSFPMSALQYTDQQNKQMQSTLNSIQSAMDEHNQLLDDIVNGEPNPVKPDGSDSVGDLEDAENNLKGESQAGLDDGLAYLDSAFALISQFAPAFLCVIQLFTPFANLPIFSALLIISLGLSVCAIVLNIGLDVGRKGVSSARKNNAGKSSGKGKG